MLPRPAPTRAAALAALALLLVAPARADVVLPHVLGDHMVLQRDRPVPIWGRAEPGEAVAVELAADSGVVAQAATQADAQGRWRLELPPLSAGGPYTLAVRGRNTLERRDVLVGEVWFCSGQSNMEWELRDAVDGAREVAAASDPSLRLFLVPREPAGQPRDDTAADWQPCTPASADGFSAVAYYFGRELRETLGVPVGLIDAAWGGTRIEPWTPREAIEAAPALRDVAAEIETAEREYVAALRRQLEPLERWASAAEASYDVPGGAAPPPMPECPLPPLQSHQKPTGLWNGMVAPVVPFALRGALWYQGEQNIGEGLAYHQKLKALIAGWRAAWGQGDFPFYFVQLAPFRYEQPPFALAELREAQSATLSVPNTGMAVTTDVGALDDIHPRDKKTVGHRLALLARARTYGEAGLVDSGPVFAGLSADGARLRVRFTSVGGGLRTRDGRPPDAFEVAGEGGAFAPASAQIDGDSVLLSAEGVPAPRAMRFAWHQEASPNLVNAEGLPASPFRASLGAP
jgi:sialate O-acetylesterase